jgi:hypothetical protein
MQAMSYELHSTYLVSSEDYDDLRKCFGERPGEPQGSASWHDQLISALWAQGGYPEGEALDQADSEIFRRLRLACDVARTVIPTDLDLLAVAAHQRAVDEIEVADCPYCKACAK